MKRTLFFGTLLLVAVTAFAKEPAWLTDRSEESAYIGVGSSTMDTPGWEQAAGQNALGDLARQISVLVETNSFLATMEMSKSDKEYFAQTTQASSKNLLDGHELVGTYKDKKTNTYFVCYRLDKKTYLRNKTKKENELSSVGSSYLNEAEQALSKGELFRALTYYEKGLAEMEPWLFLDIPVANDLYRGYLSAFDGLKLTVEPASLLLTAGAVSEDITVRLTRQGANIVNMPLAASFIEGSGVISENRKTDAQGIASFRLTAMNTKEPVAQIRFALAPEVQRGLSAAYKRLMSVQNWPEALCRVQVENEAKTIYLHNAGCDLENLMPQLTSILGNNHFTVTPDPDEAEIFADIRNNVEYVGVIPGEIYNLNESLVNLQIKFYDNNTRHLLYTYSVQQLRVLSPEKNSVEQTMNQCTRELIKRVQRELPKKLTF